MADPELWDIMDLPLPALFRIAGVVLGIFGAFAFLIVMAAKRHRWAVHVLLLTALAALIAHPPSTSTALQSPLYIASSNLNSLLILCSLALLYCRPARDWYRKPKG
ncbi:MAG: hypothetical protein QM776_06065 [Rhodocyclaceae bacterium]